MPHPPRPMIAPEVGIVVSEGNILIQPDGGIVIINFEVVDMQPDDLRRLAYRRILADAARITTEGLLL